MATREIELKFLCQPADLETVLAASSGTVIRTKPLRATYFDTPELALTKAQASLRLREGEGCRLQTLKRGTGLVREEVETPAPADGLDLELPALRRMLGPKDRARLQPIFSVTVTRRVTDILYQGASIELALDEGEVTSGDHRQAICEVELELKSGPVSALFGLARDLSGAAPLYLSLEGKAVRGAALHAGTETKPRRGLAPHLPRHPSGQVAFQAVTQDLLGQIAANSLLLRQGHGSEAIHALRRSIRRLRCVLSAFRPMVEDEAFEALQLGFKAVMAASDAARDLDVFAQDNADLGLAAPNFGAQVEAARALATAQATAAVSDQVFRDLLLKAAAWIETGSWLALEGKARLRRAGPARDLAVRALMRRWHRTLKPGPKVSDLSPPDRHSLRLEGKKLRYALEAVAPLFDGRRCGAFLRRLKVLQDELGHLNDQAVAHRIVERLNPKGVARVEARRLLKAREANSRKILKRAENAMQMLVSRAVPWET